MPLRRKPHVFTHIPMRTSASGGRRDVPIEGTPRNLACQITPLTPEATIKQFGDIEVTRPHLMLCDIPDGSAIEVNDRGIFNGKEFYIAAPVMEWGAGSATDHCQILISMKQYQ